MSISVELAELAERIEEFGSVAYLITVGGDGRPHVVSARVRWNEDQLVMAAGKRTLGNVELRPDVTLLWPARPGLGYALIVDGTAVTLRETTETVLAIDPSAAVLHRTPDGDPSSPSCITVLPGQ